MSKALVGNPKKSWRLFAKLKRSTFRITAVKLPAIRMQAFADKFPPSWESRGIKNRFIRNRIAVDSGHFSKLKEIIKHRIMEKAQRTTSRVSAIFIISRLLRKLLGGSYEKYSLTFLEFSYRIIFYVSWRLRKRCCRLLYRAPRRLREQINYQCPK